VDDSDMGVVAAEDGGDFVDDPARIAGDEYL
jgi:hypothetical protein